MLPELLLFLIICTIIAVVVIGFITKWKFMQPYPKCSSNTCNCCSMPRESTGQIAAQPDNWNCSDSQDGNIVHDSSKGWIQLDLEELKNVTKTTKFHHDPAFSCIYNGMKSQKDIWDKCKKQYWPDLSKAPTNLCWRSWYNTNRSSDEKNTPTIFEYTPCSTPGNFNVLLPSEANTADITDFMTWWHGTDSPYN